MKILFIIPAELSRCQGRSINPYCLHLQKKGHDILLLHKKGVEDNDFQAPEYSTFPFDLVKNKPSELTLSKVKAFSPDIVHIWNPWSEMLILGIELSEINRSKLIIHHEDDLDYHFKQSKNKVQKLDQALYLSALRKCSGLTAIWKPLAKKLSVHHKPMLILPPGINSHPVLSIESRISLRKSIFSILKIPSNSLLVGYSGSIRYFDYEFETFLSAFKEATRNNENVKLLIWGRDWNPYLTNSLIEKYDIQHKTFLLGLLPENQALDLQQVIDILCCPGFNSSFNSLRLPSRLCYYFKFKKPVFMHKIGFGLSLKNGENAILSESDDPKEWASKLKLLLEGKDLRKKLSTNSESIADRYFNIEKNVEALICFYDKIINKEAPTEKVKNETPEYAKEKYKIPDYEDKYILCARKNAQRLKKKGIKALAFYGAGEHTKRLIASGELNSFNIVGIVDSKIKGKFKGLPIFSPDDPKLPNWDVLLLSTDTQEHNMREEAHRFGLKNISSMYKNLYVPINNVWEEE